MAANVVHAAAAGIVGGAPAPVLDTYMRWYQDASNDPYVGSYCYCYCYCYCCCYCYCYCYCYSHYHYHYYLGCFAQPAAPIVQLDNSLRSVWQLLESL